MKNQKMQCVGDRGMKPGRGWGREPEERETSIARTLRRISLYVPPGLPAGNIEFSNLGNPLSLYSLFSPSSLPIIQFHFPPSSGSVIITYTLHLVLLSPGNLVLSAHHISLTLFHYLRYQILHLVPWFHITFQPLSTFTPLPPGSICPLCLHLYKSLPINYLLSFFSPTPSLPGSTYRWPDSISPLPLVPLLCLCPLYTLSPDE